jgi:nucleoside 2-deoxyribosyltransferase
MKVFIVGSDRGVKENLDLYNKIADLIEQQGQNVDRTWITANKESDAGDFHNAYKRNMNSIKSCDVLVAEITQVTSGVGFILSTAINLKKPVLALFNKNAKHLPSTHIKGSDNKLLQYEEYELDSLPDVLKLYFKNVKNLLDTKFILIIPAEIDRYLEWASKEKRMHKAQLVREAIDNIIEDDMDYQNYINSI